MASQSILTEAIGRFDLAANEFIYIAPTGILRNNSLAVFASGTNARVMNDGVINVAPLDGVSWDAVQVTGANSALINTGLIVSAPGTAVDAGNLFSTVWVSNSGRLIGQSRAVGVMGIVDIENTGLISALSIAIRGDTSVPLYMSLFNTGTIRAGASAIDASAISEGSLSIVNTGTIQGTSMAIMAALQGGADSVINSGLLIGGVSLGGSQDLYDGRRGGIIGAVAGGDGSDTLLGGAGDETLLGGAGDDELRGGGGDDTLTGGTGDDIIDGGAGVDIASYAGETVAITVDLAFEGNNAGAAEADDLSSIEGIQGTSASDALYGDGAANLFLGYGGNDTLDGRGGGDTLRGGLGNDLYYVDSGSDRLWETGGQGNDALRASGSFILRGNAEIEDIASTNNLGTAALDLTGSNTANRITGNSGANRLTGRGGNDTLLGGAGNDTLDGGTGNDSLTGGAGADSFVLRVRTEFEFITDFAAVDDVILLSAAGFTAFSPGALPAGALGIGTAATSSGHRMIYDREGNGDLRYDADGLGGSGAVRFGRLVGSPNEVTAADFTIIA